MTARPRLLASDPITGIGHMLSHPFIQHALLAGTAIAVLSGLVGYFVVLRGQVFAGDALSQSPTPGPWPPWPPDSTCGSGCSPPPSASASPSDCSADAAPPTTS